MVTITAREDIEQALADPALVPLPVESGPEGSMAWLRATVARFAHGEVHARRRAYVEAELARIDVDAVRRLATGTAPANTTTGDDHTRVLRTLAEAMDLPDLDTAAIDALRIVAAYYFGGADPAADAAVKLLLPLMQTDGGTDDQTHDPEQNDPEQAANRIGILIQACDATAALIANARDNATDVHATLRTTPPVHVMRRTAIAATRVGAIEIPEGELVLLEVGPVGLTFGHGPRECPGRAIALALAEGVLESTRKALEEE
jgi:cytochrome P450